MKKFLTLSIVTALVAPSSALAQDAPLDEPVPAAPAAADPSPQIQTRAETEEVVVVDEEEVDAEEEGGGHLNYLVFGDAYYHASTTQPNYDPAGGTFGTGGARPSTGYGYTDQHGFGLAFAGVDLGYSTSKAGFMMSLRWGQGASGLIGYNFANNIGGYAGFLMPTLAQGFVTWTPNEKFTLDAGQFGTIFGAEVAESWVNVTYSRGALYWNLQPFYHVGVRAAYQINDSHGLKFMATNGYRGNNDTRIEVNDVPSLSAQWAYTPNDDTGLYVGYLVGPNGTNSNKNWDHFVDVVYTQAMGDFTLVFNGDANFSPYANVWNLGVSLGGAYAFTDQWNMGARVEVIHWNDGTWGTPKTDLVTSTLTARYIPVENLIFSLEGRVDWSNDNIFNPRTLNGQPQGVVGMLTLGMTAQFGN